MKNNPVFLRALVILGVAVLGCSEGSSGSARAPVPQAQDSSRKTARPRDIGLVLSSGGCKGAYHLGVWKALDEAGLADRIGVISGTSIGALCSALFASTGDPKVQERAWTETTTVLTLNPDPSDVARIYAREAARQRTRYGVTELPPQMTNHLWQAAEEEARHALIPRIARACRELAANPDTTNLLFGAMSPEPLRRRLEKLLPEVLPADGPVVYASALKCGKEHEVRAFRLNDLDRKTRVDALCASAAIPVAFPPVEIDGALWQDGGWAERGGDGTPLSPILANHPEIKTVVVVYLNDDRHLPLGLRDGIRRRAETAGKRLVEIVPSRNIGGPFNGWFGVFDSSPETRRDLIAWGYDDAKKAFASMDAR